MQKLRENCGVCVPCLYRGGEAPRLPHSPPKLQDNPFRASMAMAEYDDDDEYGQDGGTGGRMSGIDPIDAAYGLVSSSTSSFQTLLGEKPSAKVPAGLVHTVPGGTQPFDAWKTIKTGVLDPACRGYGNLTVKVIRAKDLPIADLTGAADPYVKVYCSGLPGLSPQEVATAAYEELRRVELELELEHTITSSTSSSGSLATASTRASLHSAKRSNASVSSSGSKSPEAVEEDESRYLKGQTEVKTMSLNPEWNEEFEFQVYHPLSMLRVQVWDHDMLGSGDLMGEVFIPVEMIERNKKVRAWYHFEPAAEFVMEETVSGIRGYCGRIELEIDLRVPNVWSERATYFVNSLPYRFKHLPAFDIDDLYRCAMKLNQIYLKNIVNPFLKFVHHLGSWRNPVHSGLALAIYIFLWLYPAMIPAFLTIYAGLYLYNVGADFHNKTHAIAHSSSERMDKKKNKLHRQQSLNTTTNILMEHAVDGGGKIGFALTSDVYRNIKDKGAIGVVHATGGALGNTVEGVGTLVTGGLRGAGGLVGARTARKKKAKNIVGGVKDGLDDAQASAKRAIGALIGNPLAGARDGGAIGLAKGLGTGITTAGREVVGGGVNLAASTIEGAAATPGALLTGVGLMEDAEKEKEPEIDSLGGWVVYAARWLPQKTKDTLAYTQASLNDQVFTAEKIDAILHGKGTGLTRQIGTYLLGLGVFLIVYSYLLWVLGILLSLVYFIVYEFSYRRVIIQLILNRRVDSVGSESVEYHFLSLVWEDFRAVFKLEDEERISYILYSWLPSLRLVISIISALFGIDFFTKQTEGRKVFERLKRGLLLNLGHTSQVGLASHPQYSADNVLPTLVSQFDLSGSYEYRLSEWYRDQLGKLYKEELLDGSRELQSTREYCSNLLGSNSLGSEKSDSPGDETTNTKLGKEDVDTNAEENASTNGKGEKSS